MTYSIIVINEKTGDEELIKGEDVNKVHQEVAQKMYNYKISNYYYSEAESRRLEKQIKKDLALQTTNQINAVRELEKQILSLSLNKEINLWANLNEEINTNFEESVPIKQSYPDEPKYLKIPVRPNESDRKYKIKKTFRDRVNRQSYNTKKLEIQRQYKNDLHAWEKQKKEIEKENKELESRYSQQITDIDIEYKKSMDEWNERKKLFQENLSKTFIENKKLRKDYFDKKVQAIERYNYEILRIAWKLRNLYKFECETVFNPSNNILSIEYLFPSSETVSAISEIRYNATRDIFVERFMSKKDFTLYYDEVIYQLVFSIVNDVYKYDRVNIIDTILLNGYVKTVNKSTGGNIRPYILSLLIAKSEFSKINLSQVDVKQCFKRLKGVSAANLATQTAIAPVMKVDKNDKRFIDSKDVIQSIDDSINIAAMSWEDFEHLVRGLFEAEFSKNGGEVKITRASRDGGVDAIAYDPDPIRGGKIVIQAKRYTNTVGVAAVRDLYGTILNEGASKGILVTTSDYGSDAYNFATGKPITLLNGANLLFLLEQHGHKARIDINEAKEIFDKMNKNA